MPSSPTETKLRFASRATFILVLLVASLALSLVAVAQQTPARELAFPTTIKWRKQSGVTRYRLQVAADERFLDVYFDRPVTGEQYILKDLSPGYYYWRVAPLGAEAAVSRPIRFFVSGGLVVPVKVSNRQNGARPMPALSPAIVEAKRPRRRF